MKKTRKQLAAELLTILEQGPGFSDIGCKPFSPAFAQASYQAWVHTWVLNDLKTLVPELRETRT